MSPFFPRHGGSECSQAVLRENARAPRHAHGCTERPDCTQPWCGGEKRRGVPVKRCVHCGESKPAGEFPPSRTTRDRLSSWCKACHVEATRRSRAKHGRARRTRPRPVPMPCRQCGETFQPSRAGRMYCSAACGRAAVAERRQAQRLEERRRDWERRRYADDVRLLGRARADELAQERDEASGDGR